MSQTAPSPAVPSGFFRKVVRVARSAAPLVTALGLILAVAQMSAENERERQQRSFQAYNMINDQYVAFLRRTADPSCAWIDCFDGRQQEVHVPETPAEKHLEETVFLELMSMLERAYNFYQDEALRGSTMYANQWPGWEAYAADFMRRERFVSHWNDFEDEFDKGFARWMDGLRRPPAAPPK